MDALKIALETMFVGALAPPWVYLVIRFLYPEAGVWLQELPKLANLNGSGGGGIVGLRVLFGHGGVAAGARFFQRR